MKKTITALFAVLSIVALASASSAAPQVPSTGYWTSVCCTPVGNCPTPQVAQNGTPCWCPTNAGPVGGNAC